MVWCEVACVAYISVFFALLIYKHRCDEKKGLLNWSSSSWDGIACARGGRGPLLLAVGRLIIAAYVLSTIFLMVTSPIVHKGAVAIGGMEVLSTFTVWCYLLVGLYFLAAGLVSTAACLGMKGESACSHLLSCALWVWFESMLSCAILVSVVVWGVLLPSIYIATGTDGGLLSYLTLSAHNLNSVFMLAEGLLNRLYLEPAHIVFVLYYGGLYLLFSWFFFLRTGVFWYFFIDWRSPWTIGGYTLLIATIYAFFTMCRCLLDRAKQLKHSERPACPAGDLLRDNPDERVEHS